MRANVNKRVLLLLLFFCGFSGYIVWLFIRPVEIIAVHESRHFSSILVKNFPFTDKGKINWWLKNKNMLKNSYKVPKPASYGNFNITFWDFGDGYKEEGKYDRRCFDDMKTKANCIEKNAIFSVRQYGDDDIIFVTYEGRYSLRKNGELVKIK